LLRFPYAATLLISPAVIMACWDPVNPVDRSRWLSSK
jgi:hypothetical protein